MVEISIVYEGKLRCRSTHEPSGVDLLTDAPKDNMGEGAYFSPTDLVGTALGTCMLTIMGMVAQRENLDLTGTTVKVKKTMVTSPVRRIGRLEVDFNVPTTTTEVQRQKLVNAAETCPVHKSLHPDIDVIVKFNWSALVSR
jgi:putative redox protein